MNEDPGGVRLKSETAVYPLFAFGHLPQQAPARRNGASTKRKNLRYETVEAAIKALKPSEPLTVFRPHAAARAARWFVEHFPGDVLFAVKTNPDPRVLKTLWDAGVRHFDAASIVEVRDVARLLPQANIYFMHPVKSREAITDAYFRYGIRHFSLDSHAELRKIMEATRNAQDLFLHVRLSIPNDKAAYSLSGKFGVPLEEASSLIRATRQAASKMGICFHVGSQCMDPNAYKTTIGYVRDLLTQTDVVLDAVDVGGGFPAAYPDLTPPPMQDYMDAIREGLKTLPLTPNTLVLAEPGRALVAESGSVVVRVDLRKSKRLYINDGTYGTLFDAGTPGFQFPVKAIRRNGEFAANTEEFSLFGPTCDSMDAMKGPFTLPADIEEGDYIEIGQLGSYGATMRTKFNGFYSELFAEVGDEPLLGMVL